MIQTDIFLIEEEQKYAYFHELFSEPISALKQGIEKMRSSGSLSFEGLHRLTNIQRAVEELDSDVDFIGLELRPPRLYGGLHAAFTEYVLSWCERSDTNINFMSTGLKLHTIPADKELVIFRVFQGVMTRILNNSSANSIFLSVEIADESIVLSIEHDDEGFDFEKGLLAADGKTLPDLMEMKQRIDLYGGTFNNVTGTNVKVTIPINGEMKSDEPKKSFVSGR